MPTIDAHQHFWHYDPDRLDWITDDMSVLRRDYLPEDLEKVLTDNGVDGCVAVQAEQSEAENAFLLALADQHDFIRGVVGWVDLRSPTVGDRLTYYAEQPKMVGFRHVVQGEADHNFLLRPDFLRGIEQLRTYNFTYDILIFPHQLGATLEFVRRFPEQRFVIDHLAKPYIKDGFYDGWALLMRALSRYDNVRCKVSGLVTEADWRGWRYEDFTRYLDLVFDVFGPRRLMFGSDWPVSLLGGSYGQIKNLLERYTAGLSRDERLAFWGGNAVDFYRLLQS